MSELTVLEKEVMKAILHHLFPEKSDTDSLLSELKIKNREFSSLSGGCCSGFYTNFEANSLLSGIEDIRSSFSIQAKCSELKAGEMGFFVFCDPLKKSFTLIEGFFYGDDRFPVDGLLKKDHQFSVYTTEGL